MRLVELSRSEHAGVRIRSDLAEGSAATEHLVPIVASEFRKAATQYPVVFAKHPETGRFNTYVLNGLGLNENLFWTGTELDVTYVPLNVRRQPFYVGDKNALCIDLDSPCLEASGTKAIVETDGRDSAYLKEILSILHELMAGQEATGQFITTLLSLDLLTPYSARHQTRRRHATATLRDCTALTKSDSGNSKSGTSSICASPGTST